MKLAISNIGWDRTEELEIAELLMKMNVQGVEVAPTKINPDPCKITKQELAEYRNLWNSRGIEIIALQALLFGRLDLTLFESEQQKTATTEYLKIIIDIGKKLGCQILVFGSPKNRYRMNISKEQANSVAIPFFKELGTYAYDRNMKLCIEHNPEQYGSNFIENAAEALALVQAVNHPGFGLHLDAGALILSGNGEAAIVACKEYISHYHVSEPFLSPFDSLNKEKHKAFADALKIIHYKKWISIEMKQLVQAGSNTDVIKNCIKKVREIYGC